MRILEKSLSPKSTGISIFILVLWLLVALIGFIDAVYLTASHYQGGAVSCSITKKCDIVLTSSYATVFDIPIALGGAVYYLLMFLGGFLYYDRKKENILKFLAWFSSVGFLFSIYLLFIQASIIKAFCQYCLLSAFSSTLLFVLGLVVLIKFKKINKLNKNNNESN